MLLWTLGCMSVFSPWFCCLCVCPGVRCWVACELCSWCWEAATVSHVAAPVYVPTKVHQWVSFSLSLIFCNLKMVCHAMGFLAFIVPSTSFPLSFFCFWMPIVCVLYPLWLPHGCSLPFSFFSQPLFSLPFSFGGFYRDICILSLTVSGLFISPSKTFFVFLQCFCL